MSGRRRLIGEAMNNPKVIVLRTAGTNCDEETAFVFKSCGADVDLVHINKFIDESVRLDDYHILALPGGFTYGDDIESGRILANELTLKLGGDIYKFLEDKKLVIGICNGFQVLVKSGILPGSLSDDDEDAQNLKQRVTLTNNDSGKFEARWTHLNVEGDSVWTKGLADTVYFPVAHAEGKFVTLADDVIHKIEENGQVAFRYCAPGGGSPSYPQNPNGSFNHIAGITDRTGRILGLMPHPERHFFFTQHPSWTRLKKTSELGDGAQIFQNGVDYVREHLLNDKTVAAV